MTAVKNKKWYVGAMNDGAFVIDEPPRPSTDDINPHQDVNVIAAFGDKFDLADLLAAEHNERLDAASVFKQERETLIYWLLRCYESGHRQGWEPGPNTDETMDGLLSVLANRGFDPNLDDAAKELLKRPARH